MKKIYAFIFLSLLVNSVIAQQFASSVINFSSQYSATSWSAAQATGTVNTYPNYGDIATAWTSVSSSGTREYISLGYSNPIQVSQILIYETYNCGAVDTVYLRNSATGTWNMVYSATAQTLTAVARINNVVIATTSYLANGVRLALNNAAIPGWNEIDAVSINNIVQPVGILEQELANVEFKLYPNPSSGNFKINAASSFTDGTVLIF
jgi:hypothetical protein